MKPLLRAVSMQKRGRLRQQLAKAWQTTIQQGYQELLINSERGLQVYLCHELMRMFQEAGRERDIFIEPSVRAEGKLCYPDLLICNSRRIIAVIELKYLPRGRPKYEKDLGTLQIIAEHPAGLTITRERYRGDRDSGKPRALAADALLCWAGVYAGPGRLPLRDKLEEPLRSRFLQLDALTTDGKQPKIILTE